MGVDAQLFIELTDQSCFRRFTGIDLAAGKLPQARHGFSFGALGEQHPVVRIEKRNGAYQHNGFVAHAR